LSALTTERQRHKDLALCCRAVRRDRLVPAGDVALGRWLNGDVDVVALGQELVQAEREDWAVGLRIDHPRACLQHRLDSTLASLNAFAGEIAKVLRGVRHRPWGPAAHEPAAGFV